MNISPKSPHRWPVAGMVMVSMLVMGILRARSAWASGEAEHKAVQGQKPQDPVAAPVDSRPVLEILENVATVTQQGKVVFKLPLTPPKTIKLHSAGRERNGVRSDYAFLAGHCLLVQRGTEPGELYHSVERGEIYDVFSQKKSIHSGSVARYWGGRTFSAPSAKWAIMMQEEEGVLLGYSLLGADCSVSNSTFAKTLFGEAPCGLPSPLETEESISFSYQEQEGHACYSVVVHKDGRQEINEVQK